MMILCNWLLLNRRPDQRCGNLLVGNSKPTILLLCPFKSMLTPSRRCEQSLARSFNVAGLRHKSLCQIVQASKSVHFSFLAIRGVSGLLAKTLRLDHPLVPKTAWSCWYLLAFFSHLTTMKPTPLLAFSHAFFSFCSSTSVH